MLAGALKRFLNRPVLYLSIGTFTCLYLQCFILPRTPIYQGDTAPIFLLEAARMFEGQVIYRDFFEFTLPGTQLFYLLVFKLFGMRAWIPNATLVGLGGGLALIGVLISKRLMSGKLVILPSLIFVSWIFASEPDATHHWFSALAIMAALAVLIEIRSLWRVAAAGAFCGLATVFTQSRGIMAVLGVCVFLLWEWRIRKQAWSRFLKTQICLFAAFLATTLPVITYLICKVGLERFSYCVITFPLKWYSKWYWNGPQAYMTQVPNFSGWLELPALSIWISVHVLLPLTYLLLLARYVRESRARPQEPWDRLMLLSIVGLFLFFGIAYSPSWLRLCSVSFPAVIVCVWLIRGSGRLSDAITKLLWGAGVAVFVANPVIVQASWHGYLDSAVGRVVVLDADRYDKFRWLSDRTRAGEFLFQAGDAELYYLLGLRDPAQEPFVTASAYTRPEQVQGIVEALERHRVRFVLWSVWLDVPRDKLFETKTLAPIRSYLRTHYRVVKTFTDDDFEQVWERGQ